MDNNAFLETLGVDEKFMQDNRVMDLVSQILAASVKLAVMANEYRTCDKEIQIETAVDVKEPDPVQYHILSRRAPNVDQSMIDFYMAQPENQHPGKLLAESHQLPIPTSEQLDGIKIQSFHDRHLVRTYMNDAGQVEDVLYVFGHRDISYNHATGKFTRFDRSGRHGHNPWERPLIAFLMKCGMTDVSARNISKIWNSFEIDEHARFNDMFSRYDVKVGDTLVLCSDPSKTCTVHNDRMRVKDQDGEVLHLNSWAKKVLGLRNNGKQIAVNGTRVTAVKSDPRTLWERRFGNIGLNDSNSSDDDDPGETED